jgi:hypothetical protein
MNLQAVAQTSGNNWSASYSYQRAYQPQPHPHSILRSLPQGLTFFKELEADLTEARASQEVVMKEVQNRFGKASDPLVVAFMASHRSLPHLLTEAFERLKDAFRQNIVVNLEVSTDEEGYQNLYAIVLWQDDAHQAATAFDSFVENWWIHRMNASNSDVAFVYQLL